MSALHAVVEHKRASLSHEEDLPVDIKKTRLEKEA
jgi:hypothetical protein